MLEYIHFNTKFEKRLNALKKSEKMAVSAVKKAEGIIRNIKNNCEIPLSTLGKLSNHGEARIKNCIKFDIGKGYRLVCVKRDNHLFFLYIGSHDDCAVWIENNRNLSPDPDTKNWETISIAHKSKSSLTQQTEQLADDEYEDILLSKISEKDLQCIFSGLLN